MNRREFLKASVTGVSMAAFGSGIAGAGIKLANNKMQTSIGRHRPNVIYIMADDLGYGEVGCYGQTKIETPSIDKLAAEGMRFTQHYSGSTVCAPTRCVLLTGLHTGHSYVRGNYETGGYQFPIPSWTKTIGHVFQENGYVTGCIGKWGLGGPGTAGEPDRQGFDHFYGYLGQVQAHDYYHPDLWRYTKDTGWTNPSTGGVYTHDLMTEDALEFIKTNKAQPFFLYIPYCIPHTKLQVPDLAQYKDKAGWSNNDKIHAAMISRMDGDIGKIMSLLKSLDLDENTLVIFISDNGPYATSENFFNSNGHLRGKKRDLYEGGIRVPQIARWPGKIKAGTTTDHVSAQWDFYPTCCDLLATKPPKVYWSDQSEHDSDGLSFLPTLVGKSVNQKQHEYLYWEFNERTVQAVRKGKWKLIRNDPNQAWPTTDQLFDLDTDIGETNNLINDSQYSAIVSDLRQILKDAHICNPNYKGFIYGDSC